MFLPLFSRSTALAVFLSAASVHLAGPAARAVDPDVDKRPHVVFVAGEDEYKSEESLPSIATEMEKKFKMRCTVLLSQPNPRNAKNIPGLEALKKADVAVFYIRFRELPEDQINRILSYVNAGKPVVAFRTTTHAFRYPEGSPFRKWNDGFGKEILGQKWLYHYGHDSSTDVSIVPGAADHPILKGVKKEFHCRSWLYQVVPLPEACKPLLQGKSIGGSNKNKRDVNPVAWTWEPKGGRVFYTSLGHPDDFKIEPVRKLVINAIFWAMNKPVPE